MRLGMGGGSPGLCPDVSGPEGSLLRRFRGPSPDSPKVVVQAGARGLWGAAAHPGRRPEPGSLVPLSRATPSGGTGRGPGAALGGRSEAGAPGRSARALPGRRSQAPALRRPGPGARLLPGTRSQAAPSGPGGGEGRGTAPGQGDRGRVPTRGSRARRGLLPDHPQGVLGRCEGGAGERGQSSGLRGEREDGAKRPQERLCSTPRSHRPAIAA